MERADRMGRKKVPYGPRRAGREASWEQGCGCAGTLPEASFSGGAWDVDRQGRGRGMGRRGDGLGDITEAGTGASKLSYE